MKKVLWAIFVFFSSRVVRAETSLTDMLFEVLQPGNRLYFFGLCVGYLLGEVSAEVFKNRTRKQAFVSLCQAAVSLFIVSYALWNNTDGAVYQWFNRVVGAEEFFPIVLISLVSLGLDLLSRWRN